MIYSPNSFTRLINFDTHEKQINDLLKFFSDVDINQHTLDELKATQMLTELIRRIKQEGQDHLLGAITDRQARKKFIDKYVLTTEDKWYRYYERLYPGLTKEVVIQMINDKTLPKPDLSKYNDD